MPIDSLDSDAAENGAREILWDKVRDLETALSGRNSLSPSNLVDKYNVTRNVLFKYLSEDFLNEQQQRVDAIIEGLYRKRNDNPL